MILSSSKENSDLAMHKFLLIGFVQEQTEELPSDVQSPDFSEHLREEQVSHQDDIGIAILP